MRNVALLLAALLLPAVAGAQDWRGPAALAIQVENAKGRNLPGAEILLVYLSPDGGGSLPPVLTDANGQANIGGLAAGRWTVEIRSAGHMSYRAELALAAEGKPVVQSASHLMAPGATSTMKIKFSRGRGGTSGSPLAPPAPASPAPAPVLPPPVVTPKAAPAPAPVPVPVQVEKAPAKELPPVPGVAPAPTPVPVAEKAPVKDPPPALAAAPVAAAVPVAEKAPVRELPSVPAVAPAPAPVLPPAVEIPPVKVLPPVAPTAPAPAAPVAVVPPTPAPVAAAVVAAPAAAAATPRARLCVECPPGESAAWGEAAIDGGAKSGCPEALAARLKNVDLAEVAALSRELAAGGAGCRVIAVELPAGARFTGFRYEAQSATVAADCLPGRGCPAGDCRFPHEPVLRQEGNRTVLLVAFESTAADLRRAVVAGYSTYNKR